MTLSVDLFWSFRSPYSYLALPRTLDLVRDHDVAVNVRPVYPLAVRDPTFFSRTDSRFARYVVLDSRRVAEREGIPFRFPRPDPIAQDMTTLAIAAEQPRIHRLMRLAAVAQLRGRSLELVGEVARVLWDGRVEGWDQGRHIADAVLRAGLDLDEVEAFADANPVKVESVIAQNERDHASSGHWGVPTFVFKGEPFFGQDRFDTLLWRLGQHGMARRTAQDPAATVADR